LAPLIIRSCAFRQDTARDFGSHKRDPDAQDNASWLVTALRIVPVIVAAFVLGRALQLELAVVRFLAVLGFTMLLAPIWVAILRRLGLRDDAPRDPSPRNEERRSQ